MFSQERRCFTTSEPESLYSLVWLFLILLCPEITFLTRDLPETKLWSCDPSSQVESPSEQRSGKGILLWIILKDQRKWNHPATKPVEFLLYSLLLYILKIKRNMLNTQEQKPIMQIYFSFKSKLRIQPVRKRPSTPSARTTTPSSSWWSVCVNHSSFYYWINPSLEQRD